MKELSGVRQVSPIVEGYKLILNSSNTEYFVNPNKNLWVGDNFKRHLFPNDVLSNDIIWTLEPICNSGIWIDGEYPFPNAKAGTLLLVCLGDGKDYRIAMPLGSQWLLDEDFDHLLVPNFGKVVKWMWING